MTKTAPIGFVLACCIAAASFPSIALGAFVRVDVEVNEADRIVLHFTVRDFYSFPVSIDGQDFKQLSLPGEPAMTEKGAPALPKVCRSVIIPDDAEMAARVLSGRCYEVSAKIAPSKGRLLRTVEPADVPCEFGPAYTADAFYSGELVTLHEPYIMRNYRGLVVQVNPFQYNPVSSVLRVYTELTVEVAAVGPGQVNVLERNGRGKALSRAFHDIYRSQFLNYNLDDRYGPVDEEGDMLIICHDPWISNLAPLAAHKASVGINTTIVGVSTMGNNAAAIKDHIQNVYDNSDLAFVLLVGDAEQVATPHEAGGASDPSYAKVAGLDDYPDIMVGRFSAESAAQVDTQVQRTIEYELTPATQQDWFWRGAGIGSDTAQLDAIREALLSHGYTLVDQLYDPGATPAMIAAALNDGRGIVNYTGRGATTCWLPSSFCLSDVQALINDDMLPFIFSVASLCGDFEGTTCLAESWLRAEHNSAPTGAVGAYMSAINQYWAEPLVAQQEFVSLYLNGTYVCFGTLCFAGSCRMMDEYGYAGAEMFDGWILFGDPSLRIVGSWPLCPGDLNGDGFRNATDFSLFASAYGSGPGDPDYNPDADFDHDGYVNMTDFTNFAGFYLVPCP